MPINDFLFRQTKTIAPAMTIGDLMKKNEQTEMVRDQEAVERHRELVNNISGSMRLKTREKEVGSGVYGDKYEDILSESERKKQAKSSGSELGIKAENKKLLLGAENEYQKHTDELEKKILKSEDMQVQKERRPGEFDDLICLVRIKDIKFDEGVIAGYMSEVDQERFDAMDILVEDFVNQDYSFDFSTDQMFARESLRIIQMNHRAESFKNIMLKNMDYWDALAEESKVAIMEKLSQASQIWKFYGARKELLCNEFYSTHLDKEMSYYNVNGKGDDEIVRHGNVQFLMEKAEIEYEKLKNLGEEDAEQKTTRIIQQKLKDESVYSRVVGRKGEEIRSKSQGFRWLDLFGAPLNFVSWIMRNKRTSNHGYDTSKDRDMDARYRKYPESLKNIGKDGRRTIIRAPKGPNDVLLAPNIDLVPLFKDQLKLDIIATLEANAALDEIYDQGKEEKQQKEEYNSRALYGEFADAAQKYCSIGGIVNADTTELEMSLLDKMKKHAEFLNKSYGNRDDVTMEIRARVDLVNLIMGRIKNERSGNLANVANKDEYESAVRTTHAIVQDTTFEENVDESNIKDIPLFTHYPNINDIKQGTIGDCYLVAAMTSFVKTSPSAVMNMFQDLGDGDVMVRLYEAYDKDGNRLDSAVKWSAAANDPVEMKPVYIKVRKHYETGDGNANDCVWPQLIEKAYAASGFNMKGEAYVDEKGYLHNMEKELTAGHGFIALSHLTGSYQKDQTMMKPLTDQEDRQEKQNFLDFFDTEECRDRLSAGIPRFFVDYMMDNLATGDRKTMEPGYFLERFTHDMEDLCRVFGSHFLQIKKNFLRNGMNAEQYAPVIQHIADSIGMTLAPDWDTRTTEVQKVALAGTQNTVFDVDEDYQMWDGMFDRAALTPYATLFKQNFESMRTGGLHIVGNARGLDLPEFSFDNVNNLLKDLSQTGISGTGELATGTMRSLFDQHIDKALNFGADEEKRKQRKKELADFRKKTWQDTKNAKTASRYMKRLSIYEHTKCKENTITFLADLQEALDAGGSLEVSINHFVSAVGLERLNGEYYVLIKDPFNVYNMQYSVKDGHLDKKEDGFLDVLDLDGYEVKRYLSENEERTVYGGFRGLSYWKANDICAKMKGYTIVKPQDIK